MSREFENAVHRIESFARQILAPAVHPVSVPLAAAVYQCPERIAFDQAVRQTYVPVDELFRWGPVWSTAWFRLAGRMPEAFAGRCVGLRFSTGTEALLWRDGVPRQGLDGNHGFARLTDRATAGEAIELHVEAACNRPFGDSLFPWDHPEEHLRWGEPTPGRLEQCDLAVFDEGAWLLWQAVDFARQLLLLLPAEEAYRARLLAATQRAVAAVNPADVAGTCAAAARILLNVLQTGGSPGSTRCTAVGHAHIDTAWLWRVRETRRKCLRTFSTVLRLMERHPGFRFIASQAQQYAWVERDAPALFTEISRRVAEGRWEAGGAMWIEPDCNVPSGESLVRQVLHGTRYWREKFGEQGAQSHLYLPDTFGFCAALPQIMRLSGLSTFVTNKLSWNDACEFPHMTFVWRGLDGSEVLAHCTPGGDYNSDNRPYMLRRGAERAARLAPADAQDWLQPYGYGDGGGGPTETTILHADLARDCPVLPRVEHGRIDAFCAGLHVRRKELQREGRDLPAWDGELYLQYHRGTYTTQAWLKQENRRLEHLLRTAEWLACFGPVTRSAADLRGVAERLDGAWKALLLAQFHDILPGSSIAEVYSDTRADLAEARRTIETVVEAGASAWAATAKGGAGALLVLNPRSHTAAQVIDTPAGPRWAADVPAMGLRVVESHTPIVNEPPAVRVDGRRIANGLIEVEIDAFGRIGHLRSLPDGRPVGAVQADGSRAPLNQLVLYTDVPGHYDAWEIARHDRERGRPVADSPDRIEVVERHRLRAAIEVERRVGAGSRIIQRYVVTAGSPRVDIQTRVDWQESRVLLRALFPADVRSDFATYDTQFGVIRRPTHANSPWDSAMHEVPAQRWMDLSESGLGLALLNDGKYGHSCHGATLGLTLLRSPAYPDPQADRGEHAFTYSVLPHAGDWRAAGVDVAAEALNAPLIVRRLEHAGGSETAWAPFTLTSTGGAGMEVVAAKPAESGNGRVLRLCETRGGGGVVCIEWHIPAANVFPVDLLERPLEHHGFVHDAEKRLTTLPIRSFQISTFMVGWK